MTHAINTWATSTLPFRDNHKQDQILNMWFILLETSAHFFSLWRTVPNKNPNNITGFFARCPMTLSEDTNLLLQVPSCRPTDFFADYIKVPKKIRRMWRTQKLLGVTRILTLTNPGCINYNQCDHIATIECLPTSLPFLDKKKINFYS